jgi:hypothetical protein
VEQHVVDVDDVDSVPRVQRDTAKREKGTERGGEGGGKGSSGDEKGNEKEEKEEENVRVGKVERKDRGGIPPIRQLLQNTHLIQRLPSPLSRSPLESYFRVFSLTSHVPSVYVKDGSRKYIKVTCFSPTLPPPLLLPSYVTV